MIEAKGNMWDADVDAFVITTNGFVKKNGEAVMGRGCAKEAAQKCKAFPELLGRKIKEHGNHVFFFGFNFGVGLSDPPIFVFTMPVKHNWWEAADIELIERSLKELVEDVNSFDGTVGCDFIEINSLAMPRPGCGNGQLDWKDVKSICEKYLDDRFIVYDY